MLKLFVFEGAETDWVAAPDMSSAKQCLIDHYGITMSDIVGSYFDISEADPSDVSLYLDEVDAETGKTKETTAAEQMVGKTKPFLVSSTYC